MIKTSSSILLLLLGILDSTKAQSFTYLGEGYCRDVENQAYNYGRFNHVVNFDTCKSLCLTVVSRSNLRGVEYKATDRQCDCEFEAGQKLYSGMEFDETRDQLKGTGYPTQVQPTRSVHCAVYDPPASITNGKWTEIGEGFCQDASGNRYDFGKFNQSIIPSPTLAKCQTECERNAQENQKESFLKGVAFKPSTEACMCHYASGGHVPESPDEWDFTRRTGRIGNGEPATTMLEDEDDNVLCYTYESTKMKHYLRSQVARA
mmetsp:Transcript_36511/g.88491  ORF Transcript_36511/g.88491 Transcript_36511/m.88491 type:complete len:261 (+) Transcript_36511:288-1070(+)|eukprot:CAMPEP_0113621188 /NCGR_PEP_ID=MMETSP0017_2-20120614/10819_1 /TAXON_ID=2856 /ORGANISM="Cylindrotheca closterium" /LENGTH=260 /DNA_ID=CAMNT_0000530911 /DNA_START=144 /DNA_END=926 /DNA_ORIENTATION=+ /assembly_acc=CAM_ASM_000147